MIQESRAWIPSAMQIDLYEEIKFYVRRAYYSGLAEPHPMQTKLVYQAVNISDAAIYKMMSESER